MDLLFVATLLAHLVVSATAIVIAIRSRAFTRGQVILQSLLSLAVPVVGAIVVIISSSEATAPPEPPKTSDFEPSRYGPE